MFQVAFLVSSLGWVESRNVTFPVICIRCSRLTRYGCFQVASSAFLCPPHTLQAGFLGMAKCCHWPLSAL